MRKNLHQKTRQLLMLAFTLFSLTSIAQINVQIGIGTGTQATSGLTPYTTLWHDAKVQYLISKAELNALNIRSGQISSLAFNITTASTQALSGFTIKMANTPATALSGYVAASFTTCLSSGNAILPTTGWNVYNFTTPFFYNNQDNIVIEICFDDSTFASNYTVQSSTTSFNSAFGTYGDNSAGCNPGSLNSSATPSSNRPNMRVNYLPTSSYNNIGIISIDSPTTFCSSLQNVSATVGNFGNNIVTGFDVNWSVNGVLQTPLSSNSTLDTIGGLNPSTLQVMLGSYYFPSSAPSFIQVWTSGPNYLIDTINDNDSASVTKTISLNGTYTIGGAIGPNNFPTIDSAINTLTLAGVCGPVLFNVNPSSGPYSGSLSISDITGSSNTNTITFNGNGAIITSAVSPIISFNSASYITIDSFNITGGVGFVGGGVHVTGASHHLTFTKNIITVSTTSATTVNYGFAASGSLTSATTVGNNAQYITFTNNEVIGGYYSFSLIGNTGYADNYGHYVANNIFRDFYYYGAYILHGDSINFVNNDINRANRATVTTLYGIYLSSSRFAKIQKNKLHDFGVASYLAYPIYIPNCVNSAGFETEISNNIIYNIGQTSSTFYGIYSLTTALTNVNIYHNTIQFEVAAASTGSARGMQFSVALTNVNLKNNIINITGGGTGIKTGIYVTTASTSLTSDNNNITVNTTANNNIGYWTAARASLADWQTASGMDANSNDINPQFTSLATGNLKPLSLALDNLGTAVGVTTDITNAARSLSLPDIGAYEFTTTASCSGMPNAGNAVSDIAYACSTQTINLNLDNATNSLGLKYQWLVSTSGSVGTYSPLANDTLRALSRSQSSTNWYKCIVRCLTNYDTSTAVTVRTTTVPFNGVYTINKSAAQTATNYTNYATIVEELNCVGVSGPVTFNVITNSGPYDAGIEFGNIPNTSATNTITFNGNGNTITGTISPIISFKNSSYITLDSFNIIGGTGFAGGGINVSDASHHLTFNKNKIEVGTTATSATNYGFAASGSLTSATIVGNNAQYITFTNNEVIGGYCSFSLTGNTGYADNYGHYVANNIFRDFYYYGAYIIHGDSIVFFNNDINRANRPTVTTLYGIYLSTSRFAKIQKNKLHNFGVASYLAYPIYIPNCVNSAGFETEISNNIIYNIGQTNSTFYGIYSLTTALTNVNIYHNTIQHDVATASTGTIRGMQFSVALTNVNLKNNIINITGGGTGIKTGIYVTTTSSSLNSDNNNIIVNTTANNNIGYWTTANASLVDWQTASGMDANSNDINPQFTNLATGNLKPLSVPLDNLGAAVGVTTDITNAARSLSLPDIGAYEFTTAFNCNGKPNAGVAVSDVTYACSTQTINLSLDSTTSALGLNYQWLVSSTSAVGTFTPLYNDTLNTLSLTQNSSNWYKCIVSCGSNIDTSKAVGVRTSTSPLSGVYTINKNAAQTITNYTNFASVIEELNCVGVSGPVTYNVVGNSGPYDASIEFGNITTVSATNTITFNGNGNTITGSISPLISFNNTSYVTLDSFNIVGETGYAGFGIHVTNQSSHLTFTRNIINVGTTATGSGNAGFVVSGSKTSATTAGNNASFITFINNEIIGGYYSYTSTGEASYLNNVGHNISNNIFRDFYLYGVYLLNADSITLHNNDINRATRGTVSSFYGIYLSTARNIKVTNNKIHDAGTGSYIAYPVYVTTSVNSVGFETQFINNTIYNINTSSSIYAYYLIGTRDGLKFYHNTIDLNLQSSTGVVRGIYMSTAPDNHDFKNNIISIRGTGTGIKYLVYAGAVSATVASNYNILHMDAIGGTNYIGYVGANQTTLADWRTASNLDVNSIAVNPVFTASALGDLTPLSINADNIGSPVGVLTDINGNSRSITTPDAGAYEFTGISGDMSLLDASLKRSGPCYSTNDSIFIEVKNTIGITVDFAIDPLTVRWNITGPVNSSGNLVLSSGTLAVNSTIISFNSNIDLSIPGTYNLTVYIEPNGVNNALSNDTLILNEAIKVQPLLSVAQRNFTVTSPSDTVVIQALSPVFPSGDIFFSEISHFGSSTGAPTNGWPAYLRADDYVEISGVPNSDLAGITMEEWNATALTHSVTFPIGTVFSPNGTLVLATGQLTGSVAVPASFYYHTGNTITHSSTTVGGYLLKNSSGVIIDAVGYGNYTFLAASGVTSSDWSGATTAGNSGIRLNATDNNTASNWINSSVSPQDPNVLNANVPFPTPHNLTGFNWTFGGTPINTSSRTTVGPWTTPGIYAYVATYTNTCGTFYDTVFVAATSTVPVKLISFTGKNNGLNADLMWQTATEKNAYLFEVFASVDGKNFNSIGKVNAKGNSNITNTYTYSDVNALANNNKVYYKLKAVDFDGAFAWSDVVIVASQNAINTNIQVYPNPFNNNVTVSLVDNTNATIDIISIEGVNVYTTTTATNKTNINLNQLANGIYFIKVTQNGSTNVQKLVKQ